MSRVEVRTEALGGSPLSVAARSGRLPQWFPPLPRDRHAWEAYARNVAESVSRDWLDGLAPAFDARGAAAKRLALSANGRGIVVTTGQQPGLFGGPIMTLAKAISARALADVLAELTGLPVAPVFWAATDDADFDEAAGIWVSSESGALELRLAQRPPVGTPLSLAPLDAAATSLVEMLRVASGSAPHASYLNDALRAYDPRSGATIGGAYITALRALLEPLEIAVLDASHEALSARAATILSKAARSATSLAEAVRARSDAIRAAGFEPQVEEVPGLSLVSIHEQGTKRRLPIAEAVGLATGANDGTGKANRTSLSSTVLLRPVMERAIVPTAAYVGGPGEVAYFAQVTAVAEALDVAVPRVLPRWSTTLVEPRVRRALDDLGLSAEDFADPHGAERRVARQRVSPDVTAAIRSLRDDVARDIETLRSANGDLLSARALDGARRGLQHRLDRLERRVLAGVKQRESGVMRDVAAVRGALFPEGVRQERRLAFVPFLAKYGPDLLGDMLSAARVHVRGLVGDVTGVTDPSVASAAQV